MELNIAFWGLSAADQAAVLRGLLRYGISALNRAEPYDVAVYAADNSTVSPSAKHAATPAEDAFPFDKHAATPAEDAFPFAKHAATPAGDAFPFAKHAATPAEDVSPSAKYAVTLSCDGKVMRMLRDTGCTVVTCGTADDDTLSVSSVGEHKAAVSLQRRLVTLSGRKIEPCEIPIKSKNISSLRIFEAATALLLLADVPPEKGYEI